MSHALRLLVLVLALTAAASAADERAIALADVPIAARDTMLKVADGYIIGRTWTTTVGGATVYAGRIVARGGGTYVDLDLVVGSDGTIIERRPVTGSPRLLRVERHGTTRVEIYDHQTVTCFEPGVAERGAYTQIQEFPPGARDAVKRIAGTRAIRDSRTHDRADATTYSALIADNDLQDLRVEVAADGTEISRAEVPAHAEGHEPLPPQGGQSAQLLPPSAPVTAPSAPAASDPPTSAPPR